MKKWCEFESVIVHDLFIPSNLYVLWVVGSQIHNRTHHDGTRPSAYQESTAEVMKRKREQGVADPDRRGRARVVERRAVSERLTELMKHLAQINEESDASGRAEDEDMPEEVSEAEAEDTVAKPQTTRYIKIEDDDSSTEEPPGPTKTARQKCSIVPPVGGSRLKPSRTPRPSVLGQVMQATCGFASTSAVQMKPSAAPEVVKVEIPPWRQPEAKCKSRVADKVLPPIGGSAPQPSRSRTSPIHSASSGGIAQPLLPHDELLGLGAPDSLQPSLEDQYLEQCWEDGRIPPGMPALGAPSLRVPQVRGPIRLPRGPPWTKSLDRQQLEAWHKMRHIQEATIVSHDCDCCWGLAEDQYQPFKPIYVAKMFKDSPTWCDGRNQQVQERIITRHHVEFSKLCRLVKIQLGECRSKDTTIFLACRHGKHRSVAAAELMGTILRTMHVHNTVVHRSLIWHPKQQCPCPDCHSGTGTDLALLKYFLDA